MPEKTDASSSAVLGNFNLSATMEDGKTFQISGYLFANEDEESLNKRIDLLHDVMDRQRTRAEIPKLEALREREITHLDQQKRVLSDLAERQGRGEKLSSTDKHLVANLTTSIGLIEQNIANGGKAVAEAKAKVGM